MFYPSYSITVTAMMMVVIVHSAVVAAQWTEMYIPYNPNDYDGPFGDYGPYPRDDPRRQHLHLLQTPSDGLSPVYFFAHSASGKASDMSSNELDIFVNAGYSVISWESVTQDGAEGVQVCWSDFDVVWSWFQANAATYNLDSKSVIIGGRSRGSVCSWPMAHSQKEEIQGIYMYNALPDSVWVDGNTWLEAVTVESPPAHLVYGPECTKPISVTEGCTPSPDPADGHNPVNGQKIVDRYTDLDMASMIELTDGLTNNGIGTYELFPSFAASLKSTCAVKMSELCDPFISLNACRTCAKENKKELKGAECTKKILKQNCKDGATSTCKAKILDLCANDTSLKDCRKCLKVNKDDLQAIGCKKKFGKKVCKDEAAKDGATSLAATCTAKMSDLCDPFSSMKGCRTCAKENKEELMGAECTKKILKQSCKDGATSLAATCKAKISELCADDTSLKGCGKCLKGNKDDLQEIGCKKKIGKKFCKDGAASLVATCRAKISELCAPSTSPKACGTCVKANKDNFQATGCTKKIVKKICSEEL